MSGSNPGGAGGLGGPSDLRKDSLTRLREQYAGEINTLISSLINNYLNIISGSAIDINDTREVARLAARQSTIGIEIGTANLITTSESLLKLINEMKHNIIAHDYVKIRAQADAHIAACNAVSRETDQKILDLTGDIDMAIEELSESLYVSQERQHSRTS